VLISCTKNKINLNSKAASSLQAKAMSKTSIIGEWTINSTVENGLSSNCFSCSIINFKENGTAKLIKPSNEEERIIWQCNHDLLKINYPENIKNRTFLESDYKMTSKETKDYYELQIASNVNGFKYILRRNK
jgi:hypothetical protein